MRNALFYLTYNGLYNFTNGIGTQTQTLLSGLEAIQEELVRQYGRIDVHVICPLPDASTWGFDATLFQRQQHRLARLGGYVHLIPYKEHPGQDLWEIRSWEALCRNVAPLLQTHTAAYDRSLIICVDQPWARTPRALTTIRGKALSPHIDVLLVLYSTAVMRNWETPDPAEIAWEQGGLDASRQGSRVVIADICPSFTAHLKAHFQLSAAQFAPYPASILVDDASYALLDETAVRTTLRAYGVPLDADVVLAFGRAALIKGFDRLIPALAPLRDRVHFVLISVPYSNNDAQQQLYDHLLHQHQIRATHIKAFTRDLPRALCQWPGTKMVVVPSRQESFSNIPLEVALWARERGPVIVTSTTGGFVDQIDTGLTGFLVDIASGEAMTQTMRQGLDLSPDAHRAMRHRAYQRVLRAFDFAKNFPVTLRWFWGTDHPQKRPASPLGFTTT
jgi:glycosyltransferase involved in cell wall biosynthesis